MATRLRRNLPLTPTTVLIEPFDITLHDNAGGLHALQQRFSLWLRGVQAPTRFITWQLPADLTPRINALIELERTVTDPQRLNLLMEYRRHYQELQQQADYQRSICGLATWETRPSATGEFVRSVAGNFDVFAVEAAFPPLFQGDYALCEPVGGYRGWHLEPVGEPAGRPLFALLSSFQFQPTVWDFSRPLAALLGLDFQLALCVDIPKTWERNAAINEIEGVVQAYSVHLATLRGEDSRSIKKINDCRLTLEELNQGDALHDVQIIIAVAAPDHKKLKERVDAVINIVKPWFSLRQEIGEAQAEAAKFFSNIASKDISIPHTT